MLKGEHRIERLTLEEHAARIVVENGVAYRRMDRRYS